MMRPHGVRTAGRGGSGQRMRLIGGVALLVVGVGALVFANARAIARDQPLTDPDEARPTKSTHMCGCGASCGCGDSCGCADSTVIGPPAAAGVEGYGAANVVLLSRISLPEFGAQFNSANDCWGYVSPSGREYAIIGLNTAAAFVEITDPRNPVVVGLVPHTDSLWADIKVYGNYAYVVNESGGGVQVIDLAGLDLGVVNLVRSVTTGGLSTTHNLAVNTTSGYLYLCGANQPTSGLVALSLANPANPVVAGSYNAVYVHDAHVVNYTSGPYAGKEIAFCFVGATGIDIVDVTNKSSMTRLSRTTYAGLSYSHQGWLDMGRQLLYMDDELDEPDQVSTTTTRVFNVADLSAPVYLGSFTTGLPSIDHNQYLRDGFTYQSNYRSGLHIFDTRATPVAPVQTGYFDTYPADDNAFFNGSWSVYPFFPSGNVIVSDIERGLFVLDPTFALNGGVPLLIEGLTPAPETVSPSGATLDVQITPQNGGSLAAGSAELRYDVGAGFQSVPMQNLGGGQFRAAFPALPCGGTVNYYFAAHATNGVEVREPLSAPLDEFSATIASGLAIGFEDTFETDTGWVVGSPTDTATSGVWQRVVPIGTAAAPGVDDPDDAGAACYVTGNGAPGGSVGVADVDNGATTLTSPRMDATGSGDAMLEYARWYSNNAGSNPNQDTMPVLLSNDDGATWTQIELVSDNAGQWVHRSVRIADLLAPTDLMRVRFVARDDPPGSIVEAGVDNVRIVRRICDSGIPADLNNDGFVNAADLADLLGAWGPCALPGCPEDLDGDGVIGSADLALLLGAWS